MIKSKLGKFSGVISSQRLKFLRLYEVLHTRVNCVRVFRAIFALKLVVLEGNH